MSEQTKTRPVTMWAVYGKGYRGRAWHLFTDTIAPTRQDAIARWCEPDADIWMPEFRQRQKAGTIRAVRVTVQPVEAA